MANRDSFFIYYVDNQLSKHSIS